MSFGTSDCGEDSSCGGGNSTYIMFTPRSGGGTNYRLRLGYRYKPPVDPADEKVLDHSEAMPLSTEKHVVAVWDGQKGTVTMYVDGTFSDDGPIHFSLADDLIDNNNWLGRS